MGLVNPHLKSVNKPLAWNVTTTSKKHMALHFTWGEKNTCPQNDDLLKIRQLRLQDERDYV